MVSIRIRFSFALLLCLSLGILLGGCGGKNATQDDPNVRKDFMGGTPPPDALAKMKAASQATPVAPPASTTK